MGKREKIAKKAMLAAPSGASTALKRFQARARMEKRSGLRTLNLWRIVRIVLRGAIRTPPNFNKRKVREWHEDSLPIRIYKGGGRESIGIKRGKI